MTITTFAIPAPSATDARSWVPAVRYALSKLGSDGSEVRFRDVIDNIEYHPNFPGWEHWGHSLKRGKPYPKAHRAITLAALKLKEQGEIISPRRGYYQLVGESAVADGPLTPAVVENAPPTPAVVAPTPTPAPLPVETPAVGLTVVPPSTVAPVTSYDQDPGLARIAINQTRCYGWWSERSASCKSCPLATLCQQAQMVTVAETAALLDAEVEEALRQEAERAALPEDSESVGEVSSTVPEGDVVGEDVSSDDSTPPVLREGATEMEAVPFEIYCTGCNSTIKAGSPAVHVPGEGAFHPECATQ